MSLINIILGIFRSFTFSLLQSLNTHFLLFFYFTPYKNIKTNFQKLKILYVHNKSFFLIVFESIKKHTYLTTRCLMDIMCPGGSIREQPKDWWPFRAWRSCLTFQCNQTSEAETVQHYLIHSCSDTTKHCCTPAQVSLWAQEQVWQRERERGTRSH